MTTLIALACTLALANSGSPGPVSRSVAPRVTVGSGAGMLHGGGGKVFLTAEEALELAFPDAEIERETFYLTDEQKERATKLAGFDVDKGIVYRYTARERNEETKELELVGYAYFDGHRVRTMRETVMFAVGLDDRIVRFELLSFAEPEDYIPRTKWYGQFDGQKLDDRLRLGEGIRNVTGATLTARATTEAARRVLALHHVVSDPPEPE